jgi:hypothetical protein
MQKSYLGKTKLYNYSKVKDPKNPPENRGFNTNLKILTAMNRNSKTDPWE